MRPNARRDRSGHWIAAVGRLSDFGARPSLRSVAVPRPMNADAPMCHTSRPAVFVHRGRVMSISHSDVGENLRRIVITGRLDIPGTDSVAEQLAKLAAAPKKGVVVDLSAVKFLASIGVRALITSAKAVQQRGGKMVLVVGDSSSVMLSLEATGVDELIPVFKSVSDAERAALA